MSEQAEEGSRGQEQDERVKRLRPHATDPPPHFVELVGFLGDDPNPEYARLYLTDRLNYSVVFRRAHAQFEAIPRGQHPIPEEDVTRVTLHRDARVDYVRTGTVRELDEFDIGVEIGPIGGTIEGVLGWLPTGLCPRRHPSLQPIPGCPHV